MTVRIRLARGGAKKRPFYRIVAADQRSPRDGRFLEKLGSYSPLLPSDSDQRIVLEEERIRYWLGQGAQVSDRVARFLDKAGITAGCHASAGHRQARRRDRQEEGRGRSRSRGRRLIRGLAATSMVPTRPQRLVCVAAVAAAHGVRGGMRLRCFTAEPESVAAYGPVHDEAGNELFSLE